jgi:hypothetical protein
MSPLVPSCRLSYSFIVGRFRVCFVCYVKISQSTTTPLAMLLVPLEIALDKHGCIKFVS